MEHFDLDAAVRAGVLRSDQADQLRRFDETQRNAPSPTEERFALVSGFADIMSAIGVLMLAWLGIVVQVVALWLGLALPFLYWWGATYFTLKRRMMLTSLVLFAGFALSSALAALGIALAVLHVSPLKASLDELANIWGTLVATFATGACWLYWKRFALPIAFCAFAVGVVNIALNLFRLLLPGMPDTGVDLVNWLTGPALFAWAMWWDISDIRRETVRSDVAFWLHLAAGFTIVKTSMALILGTTQAKTGWARLFFHVANPTAEQAGAVLLVFALFALVALTIDRRSLLTSGMIYAVSALTALVGGGALMFGPALFIAGISLIVLAVRWLPMRESLLRLLPDKISAQLPRPQLKAVGPRPVY